MKDTEGLPSVCGHMVTVLSARVIDAVEMNRHVGEPRIDREHRHGVGTVGGAALLAEAALVLLLHHRRRRPIPISGDAGHHDEADEGDGCPSRCHCVVIAMSSAGGGNQLPPSAW
jgi:hypothetical protein